jgi:hypothetical protein
MASGAMQILGPEKSGHQVDVTVKDVPAIQPKFWQEFLRVQIDKFILLGLVIFLYKVHDTESMKYAIGGLIVAINHNRFRWN